MITTNDILYPVFIKRKHSYFKCINKPEELVEKTEVLRYLNRVDWIELIDNNFNIYSMHNLRIVCGANRFGGYYFEGPFITRKVIYMAELSLIKTLSLNEIVDVIVDFMKISQDFQSADEKEFRGKLLSYGPISTLTKLINIYQDN